MGRKKSKTCYKYGNNDLHANDMYQNTHLPTSLMNASQRHQMRRGAVFKTEDVELIICVLSVCLNTQSTSTSFLEISKFV
jgi:hypothetical protein